MNWYDEYIEKPIRSIVKLLRDNGFNTCSSCGHEMYIQCDLLLNGEMKRLHDLLYNNGYRNYTITLSMHVVDGKMYSFVNIELPKKKNKNANKKIKN